MINKTISHYKIIKKIGEGGMGVVYLAEDIKLKRTIALKFLHPALTKDKEAKKRFLHEARSAATLDHPNICNIYEIDETSDGQMFITMAHYEGQTLKDKITDGPLPLDESINITNQIAEGLNAAHKKEIVHRDIKSANIIFTSEGTAKILDFGLAKLKGETKLTKKGTTLGTVAYMSPEQASGEMADNRSDIWSLGVLLYEMVTGQLPFRGEYEQAIMYSIMNTEPGPVTGLRTGIPMDLERVLNKALAKNTEERYQHIDDLIVDLKKIKIDFRPGNAPAEKKTKPEKMFKIPRRIMIAGILILFAIIVVAGYYIFKGKEEQIIPFSKPGEKPSLAVLYFGNDSGDKTLNVWRAGLAKLLITDLSQSRYVEILSADELHGVLNKLKLVDRQNYTAEDLKEIGEKAGVNLILTSSFLQMGESFAITAQLKNLETNKVVHAFKLTAENENELLPIVDDMTRQIKVQLDLSEEELSNDIDRSLTDVTTSNLEALKYYIKAENIRYNSRFFANKKAIEPLKKAIELDPDFAMAHALISILYSQQDHQKKSTYHMKRSLELKEKLPLREQYFIEGQYYKRNEQFFEAIESYKKLLEIYPDNGNARNMLAYIYVLNSQFQEGLKQLLKTKVKNLKVYKGLSQIYCEMKEYQKAREMFEEYLNSGGDLKNSVLKHIPIYMTERKFDEALQLIEKAEEMAEDGDLHMKAGLWKFRSLILLFTDQPDLAISELKKMIVTYMNHRGEWIRQFNIHWVMDAHLIKGQLREAISICDSKISFVEKNKKKTGIVKYNMSLYWRLVERGMIQLRTNNPKAALVNFQMADSCITKDMEGNKQAFNDVKRRILVLLAFGNLKNGEISKAEQLAEEFRKITPEPFLELYSKSMSRWLDLILRSRIAIEKGNPRVAIEYLEECEKLIIGEWVTQFYLYNDANLLSLLADAYKLAGEDKKAIRTYEKILKLVFNRIFSGDIYTRSYYNLGRLYQKIGETEKAVSNLNKFIELWKDCDPEFKILLQDAEERLKELKSNSEP